MIADLIQKKGNTIHKSHLEGCSKWFSEAKLMASRKALLNKQRSNEFKTNHNSARTTTKTKKKEEEEKIAG